MVFPETNEQASFFFGNKDIKFNTKFFNQILPEVNTRAIHLIFFYQTLNMDL